MLDEEKPLIAGVYQNRLEPEEVAALALESDPTIFYVHDSLELAKVPSTSGRPTRSGRRSRAA